MQAEGLAKRYGAVTALVAEADRDLAVQLIQEAYAQGRLTSGELELRLEGALTATAPEQLEPFVADLPGGPPDDTVELGSAGGRIVRTGDWRVPRLLRVHSKYGGVRLDLSQAFIARPLADIELSLAYGSALIILPRGASANTDGVHTSWGKITTKVRAYGGHPHLRVTGELGHGHLTIRHPRAWRPAPR